jgi:hypothetical protein
VHPWVGRRTPSRDEFTVRTSQVSHSQVYEYMLDVSLFSAHFSSRKPVCNENYRDVGHAVERFVDAIDRRFSCSPLFNRDCGSLFEVRSAKAKALSRNNMAPSPEGHSDLRNMHPRVSPGGRGGPANVACINVLTLSSIGL